MRAGTWFVVSALTAAATMPVTAQQPAAPAPPAMTLTVSGFADGADIPVKFSQAAPGVATGEGLSPAISWTNVPAGTQSFFLNMRDMDVARNKTTDDQAHWVVWNIPASATGLPEGVPKGPKLANGAFQFCARRVARWQPSGQPALERVHGARSARRSVSPLHLRAVRPRHDDRRTAGRGRVRVARQRDEGHPGARSRKGRLRRTLQASAIGCEAPRTWCCRSWISPQTSG